jgi:chromosome segregation ATPase
MPRGVRNPIKTINNRIAEIEEKIVNYQTKINTLNAKKKELLASLEKAELDALYKAVKQSGKTPAELLSQISESPG